VSEHSNDHPWRKHAAAPTAALPIDALNGSAAAGATEPEDRDVEGLPGGSAVLVVKRGPNAGSRFRLDKPVTIAGRHPDSDIVIDDITASRRHAEFRAENGHYRVVDSSSLNGTYVNRKPVDSAVLAHGDEIQIGKSGGNKDGSPGA
jgi:pSer/pThr/pTyr-binding forkhead associated (FHA) protein